MNCDAIGMAKSSLFWDVTERSSCNIPEEEEEEEEGGGGGGGEGEDDDDDLLYTAAEA